MSAKSDRIETEEMRLLVALVCMHAEISSARGAIDDNGELAARALRRADMLIDLATKRLDGRNE